MRSVSGTARGFGSPARTQILTLVAIGPGQFCVSKKTDDNFPTKISHGDELTATQTTWTLKKNVDRVKNNTADPSHF